MRELENVIERAVVLSRGGDLRLEHVLPGQGTPRFASTPAPPALPALEEIVGDEEWRRRERANLVAAVARAGGRIYGVGGAAELLGVKPSTLQSRLRSLGISPRDRK